MLSYNISKITSNPITSFKRRPGGPSSPYPLHVLTLLLATWHWYWYWYLALVSDTLSERSFLSTSASLHVFSLLLAQSATQFQSPHHCIHCLGADHTHQERNLLGSCPCGYTTHEQTRTSEDMVTLRNMQMLAFSYIFLHVLVAFEYDTTANLSPHKLKQKLWWQG